MSQTLEKLPNAPAEEEDDEDEDEDDVDKQKLEGAYDPK